MRAHPMIAVMLAVSSMSWGLGSVLSRYVRLPPGNMASATLMIIGGVILIPAGLIGGERLNAIPPAGALIAFAYLAIFSSLIGFSAFTYLIRHTRPSLALSHAYVNPVVAVTLGAMFAGELVTRLEIVAVVLTAVSIFFLTTVRAAAPVEQGA
jgi:drug/metabolite transporter (DMT)-like permease